jgi:hypothetical protein
MTPQPNTKAHKSYEAGKLAYQQGKHESDNPYNNCSAKYIGLKAWWHTGYIDERTTKQTQQ